MALQQQQAPATDQVDSLEREIRELRNLETARSQFLAAVSHELRTPLTAILTYTDALSDELLGELSEEQEDAVRSIRKATTQTLEMVDEILAFSRSGGERAELRPEPFAFEELVEELRATHESLVRRKDQRLEAEITGRTPELFADRTKTGHALGNLLSNAIEFTPEGGTIRIEAAPVDEDAWLRIDVTDTGIGIAEEDQERIFDEFVSLDSGVERKLGGTGLGLSIARRVVEMHGGEIGVESREGEGSRFWLTLPTVANERFVSGYGGKAPGSG